MTAREFLNKINAIEARPAHRIREEHIFYADGTQSDFFTLQRGEGAGHWENVARLDVDQGLGAIDSMVIGCDPVNGSLWSDVGQIMAIWNKED